MAQGGRRWLPRRQRPGGHRANAPEPAPAKPGEDEGDEPTWFEVRVVDELGEPIADVSLELDVKGHHALTTDGDGRARLDSVTKHYGSVRIHELNALRELLRPRWDTIREGEWLEQQADHSFAPWRGSEPLESGLLSEPLHTIVIQPWLIRARLIGMVFDTNLPPPERGAAFRQAVPRAAGAANWPVVTGASAPSFKVARHLGPSEETGPASLARPCGVA